MPRAVEDILSIIRNYDTARPSLSNNNDFDNQSSYSPSPLKIDYTENIRFSEAVRENEIDDKLFLKMSCY